MRSAGLQACPGAAAGRSEGLRYDYDRRYAESKIASRLDLVVHRAGNRPCDLDVLTVDLLLLVLRGPIDERAREHRERQSRQEGEQREDSTSGDPAWSGHDVMILS